MPNLSMVFDLLAIDRASEVFRRVGTAAGEAGAETEASSAKVAGFGSKVAAGLGIAGAAAAVLSAKMAGDFQQAVTKLSTTAGESQQNLKLVGDGMLTMAGQVGISAQKLAEGMYTVESAGFHGTDALTVMKAAAQGAVQENADLGKVTDAVTTILHDYHLGASDAATVTSQLVTAVSHGKISFEDMTGALHSVTPLASQLKVPLSDIAGTLSAMTASGESAEQATQNMRNALQHLATPLPSQVSELASVGITAQDMSDKLGSRGLSGTLQDISTAILTKMGPSGKVLLDAFNQSKQSAQALATEIQAMPPDLAKLSTGLLDGSVSAGAYRKAVQGMGGEAGAAGGQFLSLYKSADGFNASLKAGGPNAQSYTTAMQKATGTVAGLTVALMTTGENAAATNAAIADIANASGDAEGNIKGWAEVQGNFNQQLKELGAQAGAGATAFGEKLLPALTTGLSWMNTEGVSWVKGLGSGIGDLVKWFEGLPGPVKDAAVALAALKVVTSTDMFAGLMASARVVAVDFANSMGNMVTSARVGAGSITAAFAEAKAAQQALVAERFAMDLSMVGRATGDIAGLGAAAGTAARGGLSAMRSGLSGIVGMLGGPWVVGIAAAAAGVYAFVKMVQSHSEAVKKDTENVTAWLKAMDGGGAGAADAAKHVQDLKDRIAELEEKQKKGTTSMAGASAGYISAGGHVADYSVELKNLHTELDKGTKAYQDSLAAMSPVERAQYDLRNEIAKFGPTSQQAQDAAARYQDALGKQKSDTDNLNTSEKTHLQLLQDTATQLLGGVSSSLAAQAAQMQLKDAIDQYNKDAKDGQHSTSQLAEEQNNLAQQIISAAQAAGQQAADQAKANGVTDTAQASNAAMLQTLKDNAQYLTGPARDAINSQIQILQDATIANGNVQDAVSKMGLKTVETWDNNTRVLAGATDAQIKDLENLGFTVDHLPNGKVVVTSDTGPARDQMQALLDSYKNYTININPQGMALTTDQRNLLYSGGRATGGAIHGPGTGTSDTAGLFALSNGEHVWTAAEVAAAGGHAAVKSLRSSVLSGAHGMAAGGPVMVTESARFSDAYMAQAMALIRRMGQMSQANMAGAAGGGVERWRAVVEQALTMLGQPLTMANGVLSMISSESGGNPFAINLTDSNARAGHPSQGLMQTIPSTFAAYAGPLAGRGITDPLASVYAGINYALHRYSASMIAAGGNHGAGGKYIGYETGTDYVPETGPYVLHKGEAVIPAADNKGWSGGGGVNVRVFIGERELTDIVDVRMDQRTQLDSLDARSSRGRGW